MQVLGIDPGQTTGVCTLETFPTRKGYSNYRVVLAEQIPWETRKSDLLALLRGSSQPQPDYIVMESFRLRPGRAMEQVGSTFPSVEIIGLVEGFVYALGLNIPIYYQEPAVISRVQILPEHEEFLKGKVHASDAYKHVRYYLVRSSA